MRQFIKYVLATIVGVLALCFIFMLVIGGLIASASSSSKTEQPYYIEDNTVLLASFDEPILDRSTPNQLNLDLGGLAPNQGMGLNKILDNLDKAKNDNQVAGLFLDLSSVNGGFGQLTEIRNHLMDFKKVGKWVVAYSDGYSRASYFLASAADKVYMQPQGNMEFAGLRSEMMFFKNMFDKLDIDVQFIRGSNNKFKAFGETFVREDMSEANREQSERLLSSLWNHYLEQISASRNLSTDRLNLIADSLLVRSPEDAVKQGLVDELMYRDQVMDLLKKRSNTEQSDELELAELKNYFRTPGEGAVQEGAGTQKGDIAIVYAEGSIVDGESSDGSIGGTDLSETIREAREDEDIKAVVLRVNSPGGSALASDVIWREVKLTSEVKPVVVSMGNVAASGGYYISAAADKIFADASTITGSIGVFGMIPNMEGFFNDKMGITFDGVKTNKYADMMTFSRALRDDEKKIIQGYIDEIYDDFKQKVAEGRNMTVEQVDEVGQGRVWTGIDAKAKGLVDEIGGLEAAIAEAKKLADINTGKEIELPEQQDVLEQILEDMTGQAAQVMDERMFGSDEHTKRIIKKIESVRNIRGLQARMPFDIHIH